MFVDNGNSGDRVSVNSTVKGQIKLKHVTIVMRFELCISK